MNDQVVVIGGWDDPASHRLRLQDFIIGGESMIPVFTDEATFKRMTAGTPYADQGIAIDRDLLLSILRGDERLLLDPGTPHMLRVTKATLAEGVDRIVASRGGLSA